MDQLKFSTKTQMRRMKMSSPLPLSKPVIRPARQRTSYSKIKLLSLTTGLDMNGKDDFTKLYAYFNRPITKLEMAGLQATIEEALK